MLLPRPTRSLMMLLLMLLLLPRRRPLLLPRPRPPPVTIATLPANLSLLIESAVILASLRRRGCYRPHFPN
jgi:hypothetical protein